MVVKSTEAAPVEPLVRLTVMMASTQPSATVYEGALKAKTPGPAWGEGVGVGFGIGGFDESVQGENRVTPAYSTQLSVVFRAVAP